MRRLTVLTATALIALPGMARAAEPPCLTPGEFTSLASYAMPSVIKGTTQRCAASLGPKAYLPTAGKQLAARYAGQKTKHWLGAKAAFLKLSNLGSGDAGKMLRDMPDPSLQGILDAMMESMVAQQIPVDRCTAIDRVVGLLSPLPAENTAELIALAVGLGAKSDNARIGKITLCKA
jgi:hypothetical protein